MSKEHGHGNRISASRSDRDTPVVRKVPANSVPYGESISRNGRTVWVALEGERVVCVAASSAEVRRKFYDIRKSLSRAEGGGEPNILSASLKKTAANVFST